MKDFALRKTTFLELTTNRLEKFHRRVSVTQKTSILLIEAIVPLGFIIFFTSKTVAILHVFGIAIFTAVLIFLIRSLICWVLEFTFISWFYKAILLSFGDELEPQKLSTTIHKSRCSKYGYYKALYTLQSSKPLTTLAIAFACISLYYLVVPLMLFGYCAYLRFFSEKTHSELESLFLDLAKTNHLPSVLFSIEKPDQLYSLIDELVKEKTELWLKK